MPTAIEQSKAKQFEEFCEKALNKLIGFYLKRGLSREDAEDAATEVLIRYIKGYQQARYNQNMALVWKIASNQLIDIRRKAIRQPIIYSLNDETESTDNSNIENHIRLIEVHEAIRRLPDSERRLLEMYLCGCSDEQIAQEMRLETKTVKNKLYLAIKKLRPFVV